MTSKAKITSPEAMRQDQITDDMTMTPLERLELAFQLSDFAHEINQHAKAITPEPSTIQWIELGKRAARL